MNVDQRMADALSDLKEALGDGVDIESAVRRSAIEYGFRPEMLSQRADRELGKLSELGSKVALERATAASESHIRSIFLKVQSSWGFHSNDEVIPEVFVRSLEKDFEFAPKEEAGTLAAAQERAAFLKIISESYYQALNNAQN